MTDELEGWFRDLPRKLQRELAGKFRARVDHASATLAEAAPFKTGATRGSVRVRRRRHELDVEILAGGAATTKEVRKGATGTAYDYALAGEFGTEHQDAKPWFYKTWFGGLKDETASGIADDVADIVSRA